MNKIYLLLGSNIGPISKNLSLAKKHIQQEIGKINRESSVYVTKAWGKPDQADFLNQVIIVNTNLDPSKIMQLILKIEKSMGRVRSIKNAPRIIDIDILFYNKEIISLPNLSIPHPLIQERRFVLAPLNELSPNLKHPILQKNIHELLTCCKDSLAVNKI